LEIPYVIFRPAFLTQMEVSFSWKHYVFMKIELVLLWIFQKMHRILLIVTQMGLLIQLYKRYP